MDDPAGASSQQREECWYGLLLTVAVPAKQVCSPVGDRCDQIMNDVCQFRSLVDYCVGYLVILSKVKLNKSVGPDGISHKILKELATFWQLT